jgi:hypothetical protein
VRPMNAPPIWPSIAADAAPPSATSGTYGLASPTSSGASARPTTAPRRAPRATAPGDEPAPEAR